MKPLDPRTGGQGQGWDGDGLGGLAGWVIEWRQRRMGLGWRQDMEIGIKGHWEGTREDRGGQGQWGAALPPPCELTNKVKALPSASSGMRSVKTPKSILFTAHIPRVWEVYVFTVFVCSQGRKPCTVTPPPNRTDLILQAPPVQDKPYFIEPHPTPIPWT